jgi:uncharacterized protein (DUF1778 family)
MRDPADFRRKADVLEVLRRIGVSEETFRAVDDELDDPVNVNELQKVAGRYGITLDSIISSLGGSP